MTKPFHRISGCHSVSEQRSRLFKQFLSVFLFFVLACSACGKSSDAETKPDTEKRCGSHNGKQLYLGPQGGCYYYSSGNNKEYVERSECNCN